MSGGCMGFIFDPAVRPEAQDWLQQMMLEVKREAQDSVPFAMDPVVYDFEINDDVTFAELRTDGGHAPGISISRNSRSAAAEHQRAVSRQAART